MQKFLSAWVRERERYVYLAATIQADLDGCQADRPAARVDEHRKTLLQAAPQDQCVVRGGVRDRHSGSLRQAPGRRHVPQQVVRSADPGGDGVLGHPHDSPTTDCRLQTEHGVHFITL